MAIDSARIEAAVTELLLAIGEDPTRPGLQGTPRHVASAYGEFFAGLDRDPLEHLAQHDDFDGETGTGDLVLLRDIAFRSMCEHHLLPFLGVAHIAYLPARRVVGLGALPRVVDTLATRPQLQERLGEQVADAIDTALQPRGVLVVLDAVHGCVTTRGTRQTGSSTVTVAARGGLREPAARAEAMALIGGGAA